MIDEDGLVYLIETNTCPSMGPVLEQNHPDFMLDMLDDTLHLTLDRYYETSREVRQTPQYTREQIESETHYEVLWSQHQKIS